MGRLTLGFAVSFAISVAAWHWRALTPSGVMAAVVVGSIVYGFGGSRQAVVLILFFITSSLLTRWKAAAKPQPEHERGRSAAQVWANGFVAFAIALWQARAPEPWTSAAFSGAIAASTADTWATEIGLLSLTPPRLITSLRRVAPGTSGGLTWLGTLGGAAGALMAAASAAWLLGVPAWVTWTAGFAAMLFDSLLGATVEDRLPYLNNNTVNLLATFFGAFTGAVLNGPWVGIGWTLAPVPGVFR